MMTVDKNPVDMRWQTAGKWGESWPHKEIYIVTNETPGKVYIILKDVPYQLAQHIIELHNAAVDSGSTDVAKKIATMTNSITKAAAQFRDYENLHLAKEPPDTVKAGTNAAFATFLERALK